ncbi:MAG TPA: hypothetical protein EYN66_05865 [Myxococcales bacterium]|nr:hypothetical protein [Myxococcales bacterium]
MKLSLGLVVVLVVWSVGGCADSEIGQVALEQNDSPSPSPPLIEAFISEILLESTPGKSVLKAYPMKLGFGAQLVNQKAMLPIEIKNAGSALLEVYKITIIDDSNSHFSLDYSMLPGFEGALAPSQNNPLLLQPDNLLVLSVIYLPQVESPIDDDGLPVYDQATLLIESNAVESTLEIELSGLGTATECPTGTIHVEEGDQVVPQTLLHLIGDESCAPGGDVATWKWTVEQPSGSTSVFMPSDQFPNPVFEANVAGEYVFSLEVWDENGGKSLVAFEKTVFVIPDAAIHVELLWHTPNDPDETDQGPEAGSDLDLHFVHDELAATGPDLDKDGQPDPWFNSLFDCFWFNAHPNWGDFDPSVSDDPGLDRDDTDGAGPENLNFFEPKPGVYHVGAHYWAPHGYGMSYATIRIYIDGNLALEKSHVPMAGHDLWDVAYIHWPSGKIEEIQNENGAPKIVSDYQNPFFSQP